MEAEVRRLCAEIAATAEDSDALFEAFRTRLVSARASFPDSAARFHRGLPADWHQRFPMYYAYPDGVVRGESKRGTLDDAAELIGHAAALGAGSLYLLPLFDSPGGDGGFDVRSWKVRESLGGEAAFARLMGCSLERRFPVVLDLPFNHLSIEHEWARRLRSGERGLARRFLVVPQGWKKTGEREEGGRAYAVYEDEQGVRTERWIIFPHASREHFVSVDSAGETLRLYHSFYPFQLDVNLRDPEVFSEYLGVLSRLLAAGVAGFRLDALHHWLKRDGTRAEGLPETYAYARLLSLFAKGVAPGARLFAEVGASTKVAATYVGASGAPRLLQGRPAVDGFWGFETRAAVPEAVFARSSAPFWAAVSRVPEDIDESGIILGMVCHHDELPGEFLLRPETTVPAMLASGGVPFRDGSSVSGRLDPLLGGEKRSALAIFLLYLFPRCLPTLYYGEEAGAENSLAHAEEEAAKREQALEDLGASGWARAFDARDVQRQTLPLCRLEEALWRDRPVCRAFMNMAELRREIPALAHDGRCLRLEAEDAAVAMLRASPDGRSMVLAAANLGEGRTRIRTSHAALFGAGAREFRELYVGRTVAGDTGGAVETFEAELEPESFRLWEVLRPGGGAKLVR